MTDTFLYVYNGVITFAPIANSPFTGIVVEVSVKVDETGPFPTMVLIVIGALAIKSAPEASVPPMIPVEDPMVNPYEGEDKEYEITGSPECDAAVARIGGTVAPGVREYEDSSVAMKSASGSTVYV
jgi:hypothetical protein